MSQNFNSYESHFSPNVTLPICDKFQLLTIAEFTE